MSRTAIQPTILKRIPSESPARCWRWDGSERVPQIGDAVVIERRK